MEVDVYFTFIKVDLEIYTVGMLITIFNRKVEKTVRIWLILVVLTYIY